MHSLMGSIRRLLYELHPTPPPAAGPSAKLTTICEGTAVALFTGLVLRLSSGPCVVRLEDRAVIMNPLVIIKWEQFTFASQRLHVSLPC